MEIPIREMEKEINRKDIFIILYRQYLRYMTR
jgi:hypothetical protein